MEIYINLHNSYKFHMTFPFSLFASRRPRASRSEVVMEAGDDFQAKDDERQSWIMDEPVDSPSDSSPPEVYQGGLAALAVQQSASGPLAPPSRRLASCMAPGSALAASLALATQTPAPTSPPVESPQVAVPATNHFNAVQSLQSRDLAQLRVELETELEQMRHDLFGAAMGVSTLKDRLDGLESSQEPKSAVPEHISAGGIELLVQNWLDAHLSSRVEQAVQATLDQALQQTINRLSSHEFFRLTAPLPDFCAETFLSQPPQILSASLT